MKRLTFFICLFFLMLTGLQIFNAHPTLNIGLESGFEYDNAVLNIGARQPSRDWHLGHLYAPRAYMAGSIMPAYPYLFEVRKGAAQPGDTVVNLPPKFARPGEVVVAKPEALALVEYLLSLDRTDPARKAEEDPPVNRRAPR